MAGEVPAGWRRARLGELLTEHHDRVGSRRDVRPLSLTKKAGLVSALERFGRVLHSKNTANYRLVRRDDIVVDPMLLWDGAVARLSGFDEGFVSPDYRAFRVTTDRADLPFLEQWLHADEARSGFENGARGTNVRRNRIARGDFLRLGVTLPALSEQKKIAAILSSVDDAIRATEAVIEQTRRVKQALLQELLTRGIGHTRFKMTEIGEIPEGWEVRPLSALLTDGPRNGAYKTAGEIGQGTLIIGQTAFTIDRTVDCSAARRASTTDEDLARYGLQIGDILITRVYATQEGCGRPAMVSELPEPAIYESNMMRIRVDERLALSGFLFAWLQHPVARERLMAKSGSSNQTSINQDAVGSLWCPQPPIEEQATVTAVLAACDQEVSALRGEHAALLVTKSALLSALLTGRIRVSV